MTSVTETCAARPSRISRDKAVAHQCNRGNRSNPTIWRCQVAPGYQSFAVDLKLVAANEMGERANMLQVGMRRQANTAAGKVGMRQTVGLAQMRVLQVGWRRYGGVQRPNHLQTGNKTEKVTKRKTRASDRPPASHEVRKRTTRVVAVTAPTKVQVLQVGMRRQEMAVPSQVQALQVGLRRQKVEIILNFDKSYSSIYTFLLQKWYRSSILILLPC